MNGRVQMILAWPAMLHCTHDLDRNFVRVLPSLAIQSEIVSEATAHAQVSGLVVIGNNSNPRRVKNV